MQPLLDLARSRPTREVFLRFFTEHLRAIGRRPELITAHRRAVSWFLASLARPPHEATPEAFARFLDEARAMGAQPARMRALTSAVAAAFDEMCAHPVTSPPADATATQAAAPTKPDAAHPVMSPPGAAAPPAALARVALAPRPILDYVPRRRLTRGPTSRAPDAPSTEPAPSIRVPAPEPEPPVAPYQPALPFPELARDSD